MQHIFSRAARIGKVSTVAVIVSLLGGCISFKPALNAQKLGRGEVATPMGSLVRDNRTPLEGVMACFGEKLVQQRAQTKVIAVGDVKDYTSKYSINEGSAVTQGGSLMVYSALGKIGGPILIAERFDPTVAERELGYTDRRQLGDGEVHAVNGQAVPWLPYFGGTITKSDYFIVGGITEVNYNIQSGGAQFQIDNIGPKARTFTTSVALDLRIVDSKSLVVVKTVSLSKQFHGYEVGAGLFRFFGTTLVDVNVGSKGQEPLQLGIRTALEEATIKLVAAVNGVDPGECLAQYDGRVPEKTSDEIRAARVLPVPAFGQAPAPAPALEASSPSVEERIAAASASAPPPPVAPASVAAPAPVAAPPPVTGPLNSLEASGASNNADRVIVPFEFGDVSVGGAAQSLLDQIAQLAAKGSVEVMIVARDTENFDSGKRDALLDQRIAIIVASLSNRGIAPGAISVSWRPDKADTSIHPDGPGRQEIARLMVRKK